MEKIVSILQPKYNSTLAKKMCLSFNSRINNNSELTVLKKALNKVEKEITNTLNAIKMGIVTTSTKEMLLNLENQKEKLLINIAKINNRKQKNLTIDECEDFLFSLTTLDLSIPENKQFSIDRFIKKLKLGIQKYEYILILQITLVYIRIAKLILKIRIKIIRLGNHFLRQ